MVIDIMKKKRATKETIPKEVVDKFEPASRKYVLDIYKIIGDIMKHPKSKPFHVEPHDILKGMKDYRTIVSQPMWFEEVQRKFISGEYCSLVEVVKDVRLIFENCYYFWGFKNKYTYSMLEIEHIFEKKLHQFPREIKSELSLDSTHGLWIDDDLERKYMDYCPFHENSDADGYCSNLVLRAWMRMRNEEIEEHNNLSDLSKFTPCSNDIIEFENKTITSNNLNDILKMWELPNLGQFLCMVNSVLSIQIYSQITIERMLLYSKHSTALSLILTSLLQSNYDGRGCTPLSDSELMAKLKERVTEWYTLYRKLKRDKDELTSQIGILGHFFNVVGESNPLEISQFHDLSFERKVWIVLSLCSFVMHTHAEIQEYITKCDKDKLKPQYLGTDKHDNDYLFFSMFPDLRVYKISNKNKNYTMIADDKQPKSRSDFCVILEAYYGSADRYPPWNLFVEHDIKFEVVAISIEGVRSLIDNLIKEDFHSDYKKSAKNNDELIEKLQELEFGNESVASKYIDVTNTARIEFYYDYKKKLEADEKIQNMEPAILKNESERKLKPKRRRELPDSLLNISETETSKRARKPVVHLSMKLSSYVDDSEFDSDDGDYEPEDISEDSDEDWSVSSRKSKKSKLNILPKNQVKTLKMKLAKKLVNNMLSLTSNDSLQHKTESKNQNDGTVSSEIKEFKNDSLQHKTESKNQNDGTASSEIKEFKNRAGKNSTENKIDSSDNRLVDFIDISLDNEIDLTDNNLKAESGEIINTVEVTEDDDIAHQPAMKSESKLISQPIPEKSESVEIREVTLLSPIVAQTVGLKDQTSTGSSTSPITPIRFVGGAHSSPTTSKGFPVGTTNNFKSPNNQLRSPHPVSRLRSPSLVSPRMRTPPRQSSPQRMTTFPRQLSQSPLSRTPPIARNFSTTSKTPTIVRNSSATNSSSVSRNINNIGSSNSSPLCTFNLGKSITITPTKKVPAQRKLFKTEVEGEIILKYSEGNSHYNVRLANGNCIPLSDEQIKGLREMNNGVIPRTIKIPVSSDVADKIEPCFIIDD